MLVASIIGIRANTDQKHARHAEDNGNRKSDAAEPRRDALRAHVASAIAIGRDHLYA